MLHLQALQLRYTPRRFVIHPDYKTLLVAEADHATIPAAEREPLAPLENGDAMSEEGTPLTPEEVREQGGGFSYCCDPLRMVSMQGAEREGAAVGALCAVLGSLPFHVLIRRGRHMCALRAALALA